MKKACKQCRMLVEGGNCTNCQSADFGTSFTGRLTIIEPEKSEIAKKLNMNKAGEYALKVR